MSFPLSLMLGSNRRELFKVTPQIWSLFQEGCDIILIFLLFNYTILSFSSPSPTAIIIASVYVCLFFGRLVGNFISGNFLDSRIHESKLFSREVHPAGLQELHAGKGSIRQSLVHEYLLLPPPRYVF